MAMAENEAGTSGRRGAEWDRLAESPRAADPWRHWGPYVSGRQWGTVREDYSAGGDAWSSFPFEQAHARAYRWGEDGIGGISDLQGFVNFSVALWNGRDEILKERLFGLTNAEGNHGEDVKEYWWPLDGTPTHSFMRYLYRYPQAAFPYAQLREENARRGRTEREYELSDTGVLDASRFFDVVITYAKAAPHDLAIQIQVTNHGPDPAPLDLLPQLWLRNTWAWDASPDDAATQPAGAGDAGEQARREQAERDQARRERAKGSIRQLAAPLPTMTVLACEHPVTGRRYLTALTGEAGPAPSVLVTDNETNTAACFGTPNRVPFHKDGIARHVIGQEAGAVKPAGEAGTKAALWFSFGTIGPGETRTVRLRLTRDAPSADTFDSGFEAVLADREREAGQFYDTVIGPAVSEEDRKIARRAFAGLLWGKQLYLYSVQRWLQGDAGSPAPPERNRRGARNSGWRHVELAHVISMPDEWEYPWFAAWDLAFHAVTLAHVDPAFAKQQLLLMCREWVQHPDGQLPAYEWAFGDVNPPVHAWAAWQVYQIDGGRDRAFLVKVFTKLLLNFSWWVNRKDADGSGLFEGGFLGMDNIGLFNRSAPLPPGFKLEQSDATSWMAFYCHQMLLIALELARQDEAYQDIATKFFEHFLLIAEAMSSFGTEGVSLWHEEDGFYYDVLTRPDGSTEPLRTPSMVGLLPLLGVTRLPGDLSQLNEDLAARIGWLMTHHPGRVRPLLIEGTGKDREVLASLVGEDKLARILERMADPAQFYSPFGLRSLSKAVAETWATDAGGQPVSIRYEPGESPSPMFGGNSNWRGPIWFPVNVLIADKLREYGQFYGERLTAEVPAGSGRRLDLMQVADQIEDGLISLFRVTNGKRAADGARIESASDPLWREHVTFSEYFDGDTGEGLGASHQTGWTALVAHLIARPRR